MLEQETRGAIVGRTDLLLTSNVAANGRVVRILPLLGLLPAVVICLLGCGRHHSPASSSSGSTGSVEAASSQERTGALLAELTQAVRKYSAEQRQVPQSLDELVAKGYLTTVPPAPSGKKFAISKKLEVYLADR